MSLWVDGPDEHGPAQGDAQALPLADGVTANALVFPQGVPLLVYELPPGLGPSGVTLQEGGAVPVGDETDVLAVPLAGYRQAALGGEVPNFFLGVVPAGEEKKGQLLLGNGAEEIALDRKSVV